MAKRDKTVSLEESLAGAIVELKCSLSGEAIEKVCKSAHSYGKLKSPDEYRRDRNRLIHLLEQVNEPRTFTKQWEGFRDEVATATVRDYTIETLDQIIHQFYCDRIEQLVQLKHTLQCRWARFAINDPKTTTALDSSYRKCIQGILEEYTVSVERARALSVSADRPKEPAGKHLPPLVSTVTEEDVVTYLRWLVYMLHTTKRMTSFTAEIQLLPLLNQEQPDAPSFVPQLVTRNQRNWRSLGNTMRRLSTSLSAGHSSSSISVGLSSTDLGSITLPSTPSVGGARGEEEEPLSSALPVISLEFSDTVAKLHRLMSFFSIAGFSDNTVLRSSEQLKLFYLVYSGFKTIFQEQVESSQFHAYDAGPKPVDTPSQPVSITFSKPSNWVDSRELKPNPDVLQVRCLVEIKHYIGNVDPILDLSSKCIRIDKLDKALFALKQHYEAINSNSTGNTGRSTAANSDSTLLWKCIYNAVDMRNPMNMEDSKSKFALDDYQTFELKDVRGSTNIQDAIHLLDHEEGRGISADAQNMPQNVQFAYLLLRHLKIRERKMRCLSLINYLCSIERTITIDHNGLSQERGTSHNDMGIAQHLYTTPADYVINKNEFMQYSEVDNRDDFYSFEGPLVRVWDQGGRPIVYTAAEERLGEEERELLLVASYYMQRDIINLNKGSDVESLAQPSTDRFAVLLDMWTAHCAFLEAKVKLINLYLEAYHAVYDKREHQRLAQVITDLIGMSVRLDPEAAYFTQAYDRETKCIEAQFDAVQPIIKYTLESERDYNSDVNRFTSSSHGLPPPITRSKLVSLSGDLRTGINHYLLECSNSLSVVGLLPPLIQHSLLMAIGLGNLTGVDAIVSVNTQLWIGVNRSWSRQKPIGMGFTDTIQQKIFLSVVVENPRDMVRVLRDTAKQRKESSSRKGSDSLGKTEILQIYCNVLQLVIYRYQLVIACHRSMLLHSIYKKQIEQLEEDESNAYMRLVPLDRKGNYPATSAKDINGYIKEARDVKTTQLDNINLGHLPLAIHELDEHLGDFSFQSKRDITLLLMHATGMSELMGTLQTQIAYQNALMVVCQQAALIIRFTIPLVKNRKFTGFSHLAATATQHSEHIQLLYLLQSSFLSFQREKTAVRNYILARYCEVPLLKNELQLKFSMIGLYSSTLLRTTGTYSLRHQIVILYLRLSILLADYPSTRSAFFTIGGSTFAPYISDNAIPRSSKGRVKSLLSTDGQSVTNLYFIPHNSEIITMFAHLPLERQTEALNNALGIASAVFNIVSYTCGVAKLGPLCTTACSQTSGTENIGGELLHLQEQIAELVMPTNSAEVLKFLELRYKTLVMSHDLTVRYHLRHSLLLTDNTSSIKALDSVCVPALNMLTTNGRDHPLAFPLLAGQQPWSAFISRYGCCLISAGALVDVLSVVFATVAPLTITGRSLVSGELSALSLLLEDVLQSSDLSQGGTFHRIPSSRHSLSSRSPSIHLMAVSRPLPNFPPIPSLNVILEFLLVSIRVERLRRLWGCCVLDVQSVATSAQAIHLDNMFQAKIGRPARKLVARLEPNILLKLKMENETLEESVGSFRTLVTDTDWGSADSTLDMVGLNELSIRKTQLILIQELYNHQLIEAETRQLKKLTHMVSQELQRDKEMLPLDLWKKPFMKDLSGVPGPQIVEDFVSSLRRGMQGGDSDGSIASLPWGHFKECISQLSSAVLSREREIYQLYASFYESTIQSLYHQLYIKKQEIHGYQQQFEDTEQRNKEESVMATAEITYNLLLEITSLRTTIKQLTKQLNEQHSAIRQSIVREYDGLMNELSSSGLAVKSKYEEYRQQLYDDALDSVEHTRHKVTASIAVLKEKLAGQAVVDEGRMEGVRGEAISEVQRENTRLTNTISKMRTVQKWKTARHTTNATNQISDLKHELNLLQNDYVRLKMQTDDELKTLKLQVSELQRSLINEEMRGDMLSKSLRDEKKKKKIFSSSKSESIDKGKTSRLEKLQDDQIVNLISELDDKDQQLKDQTTVLVEEKKTSDNERKKLSKTLKQVKRTLHQERNLKLDAFHQIDDLITQVYDCEQSVVTSRARSTVPTPTYFTYSRGTGANTPASLKSVSRLSNYKSEHMSHQLSGVKLQRPKTTDDGRLHGPGTASNSSSIDQASSIGAFKLI